MRDNGDGTHDFRREEIHERELALIHEVGLIGLKRQRQVWVRWSYQLRIQVQIQVVAACNGRRDHG